MKILETDRLVLRHVELSDDAFLLELMNEPDYYQNIGDRGIRTTQDAQNFISDSFTKSYQKHGFGLYVVETKDSKSQVGICGLIKRDSLPDVDIGFAFLKKFQRLGYGSESSKATLDYAKNTIGLKRILAITKQANLPSIKLLEKIGLKFEKLIRLPEIENEDKLFALDL